MKRALFVCMAAALLVTAAQGAQWQVLRDNFDQSTYPTGTPGLLAAWPSWAINGDGSSMSYLTTAAGWGYPATSSTDPAKPAGARSLESPTGSIVASTCMNYRLLPQLAVPNDANPVVFQFRIFDPGTSDPNTGTIRCYAQIRGYKVGGVDSANPWFPSTYSNTDCYSGIQYGFEKGTSTTNTFIRVPFASGMTFDKVVTSQAGTITRKAGPSWRTMKVVIGATNLSFYTDGVLDKSFTVTSGTWCPFDGVALGAGTTTSIKTRIDDVSVTPEPMTLALFGFGGLLLRRRRVA